MSSRRTYKQFKILRDKVHKEALKTKEMCNITYPIEAKVMGAFYKAYNTTNYPEEAADMATRVNIQLLLNELPKVNPDKTRSDQLFHACMYLEGALTTCKDESEAKDKGEGQD